MGTLSRLATVAGTAATVFLWGASNAAAQSNTIPTADVRDFVGQWTIPFDSEIGNFVMRLNVEDNGGTAVVSLTSTSDGAETARNIERVSKSGNDLVLSYSLDVQGQTAPVTLTIVREGEGVRATIDLAGGMFTATGTGTRAG